MIIVINTRFLLQDKLEGIGYFSHEILRRLVLDIPEVRFYFLFDRPYDPKFIYAENVKPIVVQPPARHPILFYLWFEWAIPRVLNKLKADLFISTDGFLSLKSKCKTLLWWHDVSYLKDKDHIGKSALAYYRYFVPRFVDRADRLITFSKNAKEDLIEHFAIDPMLVDVSYGAARSEFVPLSAQEAVLHREFLTDGEQYFLYVGAIQPRKNVHSIIEAFTLFKEKTRSSMKLVLVGRFAWKTGKVNDAYNLSAYQADIMFIGHISHGLAEIIGGAFAMVYPSFYEGFGLPVIESINCHVPAITSNLSSLPEVIGEAGLKINPYSTQEIAQAMFQLFSQPDFYQEKVEQCKTQKLKFSWRQTTNDVRNSISQVLKKQ